LRFCRFVDNYQIAFFTDRALEKTLLQWNKLYSELPRRNKREKPRTSKAFYNEVWAYMERRTKFDEKFLIYHGPLAAGYRALTALELQPSERLLCRMRGFLRNWNSANASLSTALEMGHYRSFEYVRDYVESNVESTGGSPHVVEVARSVLKIHGICKDLERVLLGTCAEEIKRVGRTLDVIPRSAWNQRSFCLEL
jgi:hypothetical protein